MPSPSAAAVNSISVPSAPWIARASDSTVSIAATSQVSSRGTSSPSMKACSNEGSKGPQPALWRIAPPMVGVERPTAPSGQSSASIRDWSAAASRSWSAASP